MRVTYTIDERKGEVHYRDEDAGRPMESVGFAPHNARYMYKLDPGRTGWRAFMWHEPFVSAMLVARDELIERGFIEDEWWDDLLGERGCDPPPELVILTSRRRTA